jgi:hypothetical protein
MVASLLQTPPWQFNLNPAFDLATKERKDRKEKEIG